MTLLCDETSTCLTGGPEGTGDVRVGDDVIAQDGSLGRVDRIVRSESKAPVYLVVAIGGVTRRRYPIVPCAIVTAVDRSRGKVHVRGWRESLAGLSESVPLVL